MIGEQAAGEREHQRDRMVGDFGGAVVRHVAHRDAASAASADVNVIIADPRAHQNAAAVEALDKCPVDRHPVVDDQRVGAPPVAVGDPIGDQLAVYQNVRGAPEHRALDLSVVLEQGIGHQYQHRLIRFFMSGRGKP